MKAKYLKGMAKLVIESYSGEIPDSAKELKKLPGVGMKMATLIMDSAWHKPEGVCVDTHVHRICNR